MQKSGKAQDVWYPLDNAANVFPAVSNDKNTNVFRISCELRENVDRDTLQRALDTAMKSFPHFRVVMRRGLFWFYLERVALAPQVEFETERPCSRIFYKSVKELLFRVSYYHRRVNLEMFHAVADGSGAMEFLNMILYHYILLRHRKDPRGQLPAPQGEALPSHKAEDSFGHHYNPTEKANPFRQRAFTISGTMLPARNIQVIEAVMPTSQILSLCKGMDATVTAYLAALLILSIYGGLMPRRAVSRPIGLTVPVDLRGHFVSESSRNFFSVVEVSYNFSQQPEDFVSVLRSVSEQLREKVQPAALSARMGYNVSVRENVFARFTPLLLKNLILRGAYHKVETATTSALSNLGRISLPEQYAQYVNRFICLLNPTPLHRLKACVCSYGEEFVIAFTSCIAETKAQKLFIRHLTENGVEVRLYCNGVMDDEVL